MSSIAIVVVNYNQLLENSSIFQSNITCNGNIIFVVDNSTNIEIQKQNEAYSENRRDVIYLSLKQNLGISKAYNLAIQEIRKKDFQYILLLDADTKIAAEYLEEINSVIEKENVDLILPIIKTKSGAIMSPCKRGGFGFYTNYKTIDEIQTDNTLSAINSGMCISRKIWDTYQYDESLFLDYVDHQFMIDVWQRGNKVFILKNVEFIQDFSAESDDLKKAKFRYSIQMRDIKYYLEKNNYPRWCIWIHEIKRKIRIFLRCKSIEVFFW